MPPQLRRLEVKLTFRVGKIKTPVISYCFTRYIVGDLFMPKGSEETSLSQIQDLLVRIVD